MPTTLERVIGCLQGVATGDAIGKQTEMLSHQDVSRWYPQGVRGFEGAIGAVIPRYVGNKKRAWRIGETTDDTERTITVARAIIAEQGVSHFGVGREMLGCTKSVHPGVQSLWEFHEAADPGRTTSVHEGCGAAIRVSPVGILYPSHALWDLVRGAREASISTHGGSLAIAAAAATAAAVSAAVDGGNASQVAASAREASALAEQKWPGTSPVSFTTALRAVHDHLGSVPALTPEAIAACCFPNKPLTIVPLALALATIMRSAQAAILLATNVGGDSDSVASIAGGILGAMYPDTINHSWTRAVESVNEHGLVALAQQLAELRASRQPSGEPAA
ncbi:MAG: ADP-ribosylglycohydrolase family protein [Vicinamibacterales bacterium]